MHSFYTYNSESRLLLHDSSVYLCKKKNSRPPESISRDLAKNSCASLAAPLAERRGDLRVKIDPPS